MLHINADVLFLGTGNSVEILRLDLLPAGGIHHRKSRPSAPRSAICFVVVVAAFLGLFDAAFQVETDENKKRWMKKRIKDYLVAFAASFSLTLTVHFYNTMPTGILCLGIAVGFCFRFCKWYFVMA